MMTRTDPRLLVVLNSLCAEGTPVLALHLCRSWSRRGVRPFVVTLASSPMDLAEEFARAQIPVRVLRLPDRGRIRYARMIGAIWRVCREVRPSAVLSMPFGWHAFIATAARLAGVRAVGAHVGNYPAEQHQARLSKFRLLVQAGRPVTTTLLCCSAYVQRGIVERFGLTFGETRVIYNGVDVDAIEKRADQARARAAARDTFVAAMVARFEAHKDQPTLIRAAKHLQRAGRKIEIWLIGDGRRRQEYEQLIAELGLTNTVKLLGVRRDIPELLASVDLFVFSATEAEGQGIALVEAMAARVPIVATQVGACAEVLDNGRLGELVPTGNPEAMAAAIVRAMDESKLSTDRARLASAKARASFSIDTMAAAYARSLGLRALS